jgi:hypothetical protein
METFAQLLTVHVIQLQNEKGRLIKQKQLVELLEVGETSLNLAWNGKRPPSKNLVEKCAVFFNDMRFYDVAGMDRPEPLQAYIRRNLGNVPEEVKKKIAEEVAQYTTEPLPEGGNDGD